MTDQQKVQQFLENAGYMVLAVTLDDGTPWALPVRIQAWHGNEFEWDSKTDTEHSKTITGRPQIAVTIFDKQENAQMGVYMKGKAALREEKDGGFGRYVFTAEEVWLNDETFVKRRVELASAAD